MPAEPDESEDEEEPIRYAVRLSEDAWIEVNRERGCLADTSGPKIADDWLRGFLQAIGKLNLFPTGHPIAAETLKTPGIIVRQMVYRRRRGKSGPAHRVLFTVSTPEGEAPTVTILHVRHGAAMRPGDAGDAEGDE